mgnify:CR=1 FL=1
MIIKDLLGRRLKEYFLHIKPKSASNRNLLKLASGTVGSQVITVAATPILTRLYGPESFGVLATFASILALLNVVSSLRYELAIAVPEDDDEAVALVWLCFCLVVVSTGLTALGVLLIGDLLLAWLNEPALKPLLWLLPVGVLLSGVYQPLSYWAIRRKQFGLLAQIKFRQSIFWVATNLAAAPLGAIGLLLGQIVSQSAGFFAILHQSAGLLFRPKKSPVVLAQTLRRYIHFGIYSSPAGLINTIGNKAPLLIFSAFFGASDLGQLFIVQKLLSLPFEAISQSISKIFISRAPQELRNRNLHNYMKGISRKMLMYLSIFVPIVVGGFYFLSPIFLGDQWTQARGLAILLAPQIICSNLYSPINQVFIVTGKNREGLLNQTVLLFAKLFPLLLFAATLTFHQAVLLYSFSRAVSYLYCYWNANRLAISLMPRA